MDEITMSYFMVQASRDIVDGGAADGDTFEVATEDIDRLADALARLVAGAKGVR